jgi:hypothetical protein
MLEEVWVSIRAQDLGLLRLQQAINPDDSRELHRLRHPKCHAPLRSRHADLHRYRLRRKAAHRLPLRVDELGLRKLSLVLVLRIDSPGALGRNAVRPYLDRLPHLSRGRRLNGETRAPTGQIPHQHGQTTRLQFLPRESLDLSFELFVRDLASHPVPRRLRQHGANNRWNALGAVGLFVSDLSI